MSRLTLLTSKEHTAPLSTPTVSWPSYLAFLPLRRNNSTIATSGARLTRRCDVVWAKYFTNGFDGEGAGEYEFGLSSRAIEACANAGVKHIIYSTLHDIEYVPHFKYKAKGRSLLSFRVRAGLTHHTSVSKWAESKGYPVTNLYVSHYMSNLTKFPDFLKAEGDGYVLQAAAPDDCPLWNYAVEQTGGWVVPIFKDPKKYIGMLSSLAGFTLLIPTAWG